MFKSNPFTFGSQVGLVLLEDYGFIEIELSRF